MAVVSTAIQDDIAATIPTVAGLANAMNDKLLRWFQAGGATSNDLQDAERQFLVARGETERDTQDMWERYLRVTLGLGTLALDDLQKKYWGGIGGGPVSESGFGVADLSTLNLGPATFVRATTAMSFFRLPEPYLHLPGTSGNYASTPDSPRFIPNAFFDVRVRVPAAVDWTPVGNQRLAAQWIDAGNQRSWIFTLVTNGALQFTYSRDGVEVSAGNASSAVVPFADGTGGWVRFTYDPATGDFIYYTSPLADGANWTQLGVTRNAPGGGNLFDSNSELRIGTYSNGAGANWFQGKISRVEMRIGGALAALFDPGPAAYKATSWVSTTGETWTVAQASPNPAALVQGELISVGAGFARHWHDPATLNPMGVLIEGQRVNRALRSEEFDNAVWGKTDTVVTANQIYAPDGALTADLLTEGVAGTALVSQNYTGTANALQAGSVWVKRGNHDWIAAVVYEAAAPANNVRCYFNIATGAVGTALNGGTGTGAAASIEAYPNGWYRISISGQVNNAATALGMYVCSATADGNATRINNGTRYQWGAHIEDTVNFCSTYIPTVAATVTRNNDQLSFTNPGIDARGAVVCEISTLWGTNHPTFNAGVFGVTNGATALFMNNAAAPTHIRGNDATNSPQKVGLNSAFNVTRKRAISWGAGGLSVTGDGLAVANTAYDGTIGSGVPLYLGNRSDFAQPLNGCIKSFKLLAFEPTAGQLAAMTA